MAATAQVLQPVFVTMPLKNAIGSDVPNGSPGVIFQYVITPADPSVRFEAAQLTPFQSKKYGIMLTFLSAGSVKVDMKASVGTAGTNSTSGFVDITATGNSNFGLIPTLNVAPAPTA